METLFGIPDRNAELTIAAPKTGIASNLLIDFQIIT